MKRSHGIVLVIAVVLGLALIAWLRFSKAESPAPTEIKAVQTPPAKAPKPGPIERQPVPTVAQPPPAAPDLSPETLQERIRAVQARGFHDARLRMAEAKGKLTLSDSEHERLLDDVIDFQHAKTTIDEPFVKVTYFDGAKLVLQIPAHPEQDATVKTALFQQIRQDFPAGRGDQIVNALDSNLDVLFDGWGRFAQTYTVEKPREDGQVHITNVAAVSEAEGPADSATARRASDISGGGWFSREILDMGYEIVVPSVDIYFPKDPTQPEPAHIP